MSIVKDIAGGYTLAWILSMCSVFAMLIICCVVGLIADESVVVLFILVYNGSLGLFIVLSAIPMAIFILGFGLVYNGATPICSPVLETILNFIAPMFNLIFRDANITVTPIVPDKVDFNGAMNAWISFVNALSAYLLDATDLPYQEPFISLILRHL